MLHLFLIYVGIPWSIVAGAVHLVSGTGLGAWLASKSLAIYPLFVSFQTTSGSSAILNFGAKHSKALHSYFSMSMHVCVLGAVLGSVLLVYNAFSLSLRFVESLLFFLGLSSEDLPSGDDETLVSFVIPGVNVPMSQMGYLFFAICVSVVFHELGHALAAASYGVRVKKAGFFVAAFFPGAFVDLEDEGRQYAALGVPQKLQIVCAGVWHNVLLCIACVLAIQVALPGLVAIPFTHQAGVVITHVDPSSGLGAILQPGYRLNAVDHVPVLSSAEWLSHLYNITEAQQRGYCVPLSSVTPHLASNRDTSCCPRSPRNQEEVDAGRNDVKAMSEDIGEQERDQVSTSNSGFSSVQYQQCFTTAGDYGKEESYCASAKAHVQHINERCIVGIDEEQCGSGSLCVSPALWDKAERILTISYSFPNGDNASLPSNGGATHSFMYAGLAGDLFSFISTTDYMRKEWVPLALFSVFPWSIVDILFALCRFTLVVSSSLAVINSVPFYLADGSLSCRLFYELLCKRFGWGRSNSRHSPSDTKRKRDRDGDEEEDEDWTVADSLITSGTLLVFANLIMTLASSLL